MYLIRKKQLSDSRIIKGIKKGGKAEEQALTELYRQCRDVIVRHIIKNNGTRETGMDIFQDTLVVFCEQVKNNTFQLRPDTKVSTYLFTLAKRMWINELKKIARENEYRKCNEENNRDIDETLPSQRLFEEQKQTIIDTLMGALQEDCRKILLLSIYEELNLSEITKRMGYKNINVTKSKKYKCKESLKKLIKNSSGGYRAVMEITQQ